MSLLPGLYQIVNHSTSQWIAAADLQDSNGPSSPNRPPNRAEIVRTVSPINGYFATILVSQHEDPGDLERPRYSFRFVETTPIGNNAHQRPPPDHGLNINQLGHELRIGNNMGIGSDRFAGWTLDNSAKIHTWWVNEVEDQPEVYRLEVPQDTQDPVRIFAWANMASLNNVPVITGNCLGAMQLGPLDAPGSHNFTWKFEQV